MQYGSIRKGTIMTTAYILIGILIIPAYWHGLKTLTWFDSILVITTSNMTVNFLLLFFLYGVVCNRWTRKMSKRKGWAIWLTGLVLLLVVFRFVGGYETIVG